MLSVRVAMYEDHFRLKSNPFRTAAKGPGVFVGPQQAALMSRLQRALAGSDNVVTVTGPVGIGKTTVVKRTLETNDKHQMVAWIGRMRLAPDEMLDLLLSGFGVKARVTGTVRRFALFKRLLAERVAANIRVVIAVEDALRIGTDALLELEALTANDVGNDGANIILMGPTDIEQRLNTPELARLRQRTHVGQSLAPFSAVEVQGYLKHCLRAAGSSFDLLFDENAANMLYRCSGGLPRVINNICDAALSVAAETRIDRISHKLIQEVALDVYGLRPIDDDPVNEAADPEPPLQEAQETATDIGPMLENRTLDDLPTLSHSMRVEIPRMAQPASIQAKQSNKVDADIETQKNHAMPDLDALATAITRARGISPAGEDTDSEDGNPESAEMAISENAIHAITLDQTLEDQRKSGPARDTVTAELAKANSLEDISDAMAETLFGIEFQEIAAAVVSNPPANDAYPGDPGAIAMPAIGTAQPVAKPVNDPPDDASPAKPEAVDIEPVATAMSSDATLGNPDSIEEQFQTSITQTQKVIDPDNLPNSEVGSEKSGLFKLFKKSS